MARQQRSRVRGRPARVLRGTPVLAAALALLPLAGASAQALPETPPAAGPPIPLIGDFTHDGNVSEWRGRPVDRVLDASPGAGIPQALTWVGQVPAGLVVAAEIRPAAAGPVTAALEVLLAGPRPPRLPPLGWGHQFGFEIVADSAACEGRELGSADPAGCLAWREDQIAFRGSLPPLFQRTWRLPVERPDEVREVRASAAFGRLSGEDRERLAPLAPGGTLRAYARPIEGTDGLGLEALIPWSALPPVPAPDLEALAIQVRWAPVEGPAAFEPPVRPLERPLRHRITPCEYGLGGILLATGVERIPPRPASPGAVPYMIPEASGDLRRLIVLDNPAAGYQYEPEESLRSPTAYEARYDVLDVGRDQRLCAPILALAGPSGRLTPPDWTATGEGDPWAARVDLRNLQVRRTATGDLLALHGPRVSWSFYGSGQCGACPRIGLELFRIATETGEVRPFLRIGEIAEPEVREIEIEVSPDWSEVTLYTGVADLSAPDSAFVWTAIRHCRPRGGAGPYEACGAEARVEEPPVRLRARYRAPP